VFFWVGLLVMLVAAARWRQRKALARVEIVTSGGEVEAPCTLRHPDAVGARWVHGTIRMGGNITPVFTGNPDQISMRVEFPASTYTWKGTRSGASELMSIAPGFVIARLESPHGAIELGLTPADAEAVARSFKVN
jgi:hypothetical protein